MFGTLKAKAQAYPRLFFSQCDPHSIPVHSGQLFAPTCRRNTNYNKQIENKLKWGAYKTKCRKHCSLPWGQGTIVYGSHPGNCCWGTGPLFRNTCCLWGTWCCRSCIWFILLIWTPTSRCLRGTIGSWAFAEFTRRRTARRGYEMSKNKSREPLSLWNKNVLSIFKGVFVFKSVVTLILTEVSIQCFS